VPQKWLFYICIWTLNSWLCFHNDTSLVTVRELLVSAHHNIAYVLTENSHIHTICHSKLITLLNVDQYKYVHTFSTKQTLHTHSRIHHLALSVCTHYLVQVREQNNKESTEFRLTRYILLSRVQSTAHHHNTDTQRYWILVTSLINTHREAPGGGEGIQLEDSNTISCS